MKRFRNFYKMVPAIGVCLLLAITSCDDRLDVEPQQSIDAGTALNTSQAVQSALVGAYERLQGAPLYGGDLHLTSEMLGTEGNLIWAGTFATYRQMYQKNITSDNAVVAGTWIRAYQAINVVNNVIKAIDVVDEADKDQVLGEAHFIRGLVYFDLVRLYGLPYEPGQPNTQLGVPLVLEPTTVITDENRVARNTVEEVYARAIEDLTMAKDLLPERTGPGGSRANTYSASAVLARIYLQQAGEPGNTAEEPFLTKAAQEANRVIEEGGYSLVDEFENAFNNSQNSSEDIFAIQQTVQSNAGQSNEGLATFYSANQRAEIEISPDFVANYEEGDERAEIIYLDDDDVLRNGKFDIYSANIPVVRLAEMYLIRAEANERLGTTLGASPLEDINLIRERADIDPLTSVNLAQILEERLLELAFEGNMLHDMKRLRLGVGALPYNAPKLVLPIPLREINANNNLIQNPTYGS